MKVADFKNTAGESAEESGGRGGRRRRRRRKTSPFFFRLRLRRVEYRFGRWVIISNLRVPNDPSSLFSALSFISLSLSLSLCLSVGYSNEYSFMHGVI